MWCFERKRLTFRILPVTILIVLSVLSAGCSSKTKPTAVPTPTPAAFSVSKLSIQPPEVEASKELTVTAEVRNTGGTEGSYTAELHVNGVTEGVQIVTIPAGISLAVTFRLSRDVPGIYEVKIGGLAGQFVVTKLAAPAVRSATWSDAVLTRLVAPDLPGTLICIQPNNKAVIDTPVGQLTISIDASEGKVYLGDVSPDIYRLLVTGHLLVTSYTKYSDDKLFITALPPWFDPRKEFAPDVDKLPFVESVTTTKGEATFIYRWP